MLNNIYTPTIGMLGALQNAVSEFLVSNDLQRFNLNMNLRTLNMFAILELTIIQPFGTRDLLARFSWNSETAKYELFIPSLCTHDQLQKICVYLKQQYIDILDIAKVLDTTDYQVLHWLSQAERTTSMAPGCHVSVSDQS